MRRSVAGPVSPLQPISDSLISPAIRIKLFKSGMDAGTQRTHRSLTGTDANTSDPSYVVA